MKKIERRIKVYQLDVRTLWHLLNGRIRPVTPFPDNVRLASTYLDPNTHNLWLYLESDSYPDVLAGSPYEHIMPQQFEIAQQPEEMVVEVVEA